MSDDDPIAHHRSSTDLSRISETDRESATDDEFVTITVENVSLSFDELDVLDDVSLSVAGGEFVGFIGPNGAGKTTLLRAISGVLEPDLGRIAVNGVDIHEASSKTSSRLVSVVPQDTSLSFSFPVRDVVEMGRHPHRSRFAPPTREDRTAVERALERTRTEALAERPIDEVSGGQRQRVVLARAIAQETPALLLDEPTASLDINHQIETLELVRDLVAEGRAVCAAIHDLDLAARYCDRLVMLAGGGVRRTGDPERVLTADVLAEVFDSNAAVTENPITGTSTVTALPAGESGFDSELASRIDRVHVFGSGAGAAGACTRLSEADVDLSLGPVPSGDSVLETARRREIDHLEQPSFEPLSDGDRRWFERAVETSDVVVLADPPIGDGTVPLFEAVAGVDRLVAVESDSFDQFEDHRRGDGGKRAVDLYETCRHNGIETTPEAVLEAVARAVRESKTASRRER